MLNQIVLIGRLTKNPEISKTSNNKKRTQITLAVARGFKNQDGIYETDFINCILWNVVAEHTCEYCKKGDLVGIKGRIQSRKYEDDNKEVKYVTEIIAEKVTFLSKSQSNEELDDKKTA